MVAVLSVQHAACGSDSDSPILYIGDRGVRFEEITFQSLSQSKRSIGDIVSRYGDRGISPDIDEVSFVPMRRSVATSSIKSLEDWHQVFTVGAIESYMSSQAISELCREYKIEDPTDTEEFSEYVLRRAERQHVWSQIAMSYLKGAIDKGGLDREFRMAFGDDIPMNAAQIVADSLNRAPALRLLLFDAFPVMVNGRVAPWYRGHCADPFIRSCVIQILERDKEKYIDLLERKWGSWTAIRVIGADAVDSKTIEKLLMKTINKNGSVAQGGIDKINEIMRDTGGRARFSVVKGTLSFILNCDDAATISTHVIGQMVKSRGVNEQLMRTMVVPNSLRPHFTQYPTQRPSFLYDYAKEMMLSVIYEKYRIGALHNPAISAPNIDEIMLRVGSATYVTTHYGKSLPRVPGEPDQ